MSGLHSHATDSDIHTPFRWVWADATAREEETDINSSDVYKVGLQEDSNTLWVLKDLAPTWEQIGGSGGDDLDIDFTIGTQSGDAIIVDLQVMKNGEAASESYAFYMWLSASPDTLTMDATPPDGGIEIWNDGRIIAEFIAGIYFLAWTNTLGQVGFQIEDSGTPTFYLSVLMPDGTIKTSEEITFT